MRSLILSERIKQRTDIELREIIHNFGDDPSFDRHDELAIGLKAKKYVISANIRLIDVFAHPDVLHHYPELSQYYRGIALLSQKQVQSLSHSVSLWESKQYKRKPDHTQCLKIAKLYNAVISSIIEGTLNWTLEDGYRNILATMGIGLDGFIRNKIGKDAESLIKTKIATWLIEQRLTKKPINSLLFDDLPNNTIMRYSSEPDIEISRNGRIIATIEIKGGKDPAGALERLGAMQKSFEETPPGCQNFLVAGVITNEMRSRLDSLGNVNVFILDELSCDGESWDKFTKELFHYTVRII